jgi:hypothetical protein
MRRQSVRCIRLDDSGRFVRCVVVHSELFDRRSFRTLRARRGVRIVIGRRRGQTKTSIQAILYNRRVYHA